MCISVFFITLIFQVQAGQIKTAPLHKLLIDMTLTKRLVSSMSFHGCPFTLNYELCHHLHATASHFNLISIHCKYTYYKYPV